MATNDQPDERLRDVLEPGEEVRWTGRPDPSVRFATADAYLVPLSAAWFVLAILYNVVTNVSGQLAAYRVWGVLMLLVGTYFTIGRFFAKRFVNRRTIYVLTERRAIILRPRSVATHAVDGPLQVQRTRDGTHLALIVAKATGFRRFRHGVPPNTGFDLFPGTYASAVGFFDVIDDGSLIAALARPRS